MPGIRRRALQREVREGALEEMLLEVLDWPGKPP